MSRSCIRKFPGGQGSRESRCKSNPTSRLREPLYACVRGPRKRGKHWPALVALLAGRRGSLAFVNNPGTGAAPAAAHNTCGFGQFWTQPQLQLPALVVFFLSTCVCQGEIKVFAIEFVPVILDFF